MPPRVAPSRNKSRLKEIRMTNVNSTTETGDPNVALRQRAQSVVARSDLADIVAIWDGTGLPGPEASSLRYVRGPEAGLMMVRGRAGGDGVRFNLGEMTVTRCSLAIEDGPVGHGYVAGRSRGHAAFCALSDALAQAADRADILEKSVLAPLEARLEARQTQLAEKAAETRVDFFTLVRGEDK